MIELAKEKMGESDFYVDENYTGVGKPKWVKQKSENCTSCHTHKTAITSAAFNWLQMNHSSAYGGGSGILKRIQNVYPDRGHYFGFPLTGVSGHAFSIVVGRANQLAQAGRICESICGDSMECKRDLLKVGLTRKERLRYSLDARNPQNYFANGFYTPHDHDYHLNKYGRERHPYFPTNLKNEIAKNWPVGEFAYPDWSVPDSKLLDDELKACEQSKDPSFVAECEKTLNSSSGSHYGNNNSNEKVVLKGLFEKTRASHPRPFVGRISKDVAEWFVNEIAFTCLGFYDSERAHPVFTQPHTWFVDLVDSPAGVSLIEKGWPPRREDMWRFLSGAP